jgi:MSHA biogenesis protein MshK
MKRLALPVLLLAATGAAAQAVQDPTRPPAQLIRPTAGVALPSAPQLQSILIGRNAGGRRIAVIDGNLVRVGDRVGSARVVAIGAGAVELQRPGGRDILKLQGGGAAARPPE